MRWLNVVAALAIPLAAGVAAAQTGERQESDLLLRVNGPVRVVAGDSASTVVVVGNTAVIDGTVREGLLVVNGTARVTGTVRGDVTVANGHLDLAPGARVGGNVLLYKSSLTQAPQARVDGGVHDEMGVSFGARALWFLWCGMTTMFVALGLAFAWLASRQLGESAALVTREPVGTVVTGLLLWAGIPMVAFFFFMTVVGIPLAFGILLLVVPVLTLFGYVVTGTALGRFVVERLGRGGEQAVGTGDRPPFAAAAVGILLLQLVALVPGAGGVLVLLAGLVGAGALAYRVWRLRRPRRYATADRPAILGAQA